MSVEIVRLNVKSELEYTESLQNAAIECSNDDSLYESGENEQLKVNFY